MVLHRQSPRRAPLAALVLAIAASLLGAGTAGSAPLSPEETGVLLEAARATALPRRVAPQREALLDETVRSLRRGRLDAALESWRKFATGYFSPATSDDLDALVAHLLHEAFLSWEPELLDEAEEVLWLEARVRGVHELLDRIERARVGRRAGELPVVAGLELGPTEPTVGAEPFRWLPPRPMRPSRLERMRRLWERRLVMAEEDVILAHLRLQAWADRNAEVVAALRRASEALRGEGRRVIAQGP